MWVLNKKSNKLNSIIRLVFESETATKFLPTVFYQFTEFSSNKGLSLHQVWITMLTNIRFF